MAALKLLLVILMGALALPSCNKCPPPFETHISYTPPEGLIRSLPSPFKPLTKEEMMTLWGKELYLGLRFAEEQDYYRAITAFKSSLFLLPKRELSRKQQAEFYLCLSYYFARKYKETYETYENSSLIELQEDFPAKRELYLMISDAFEKCEFYEKSARIKEELSLEDRADLSLHSALLEGDFCALYEQEGRDSLDRLLSEYQAGKMSVDRAETLQALMPGAGYWYVGQKKSALTSFVINTLFIAAATEFWKRGYYAASLITWSLETGWYFGGINGAGLAANEYNERLWENLAKETLIQERLFPILRFEYAF